MEITTIKLRKVTASPNMVLTNGEAFSEVGGFIFLGKNERQDNWSEITEEEYNAIVKEKEVELQNESL